MRKSRRFGLEDLAFAVFRPEFKKLGRIKDISKGGLACVYLDEQDLSEDFSKLEIDILLCNGEFYMSMIPCEIIYDKKMVEDEYKSTISFMDSRCCGLKFGPLSKEQKTQLELFLNKHVYQETETAQRI
jgi:hypothetical protein